MLYEYNKFQSSTKKVRVLQNQYLTRYDFINYMLIGQLQASHSAETITAFNSSI